MLIGMSNKKVLIVESNDDIRKLLTMVFQNEGFNVQEATDAKTIDKYIKNFHPDIITVEPRDLVLSNPAFLNSIDDASKGSRIVAVTTYTQQETRRLFYRQNISGYIQKPFDLKNLRRIVKGCCF